MAIIIIILQENYLPHVSFIAIGNVSPGLAVKMTIVEKSQIQKTSCQYQMSNKR